MATKLKTEAIDITEDSTNSEIPQEDEITLNESTTSYQSMSVSKHLYSEVKDNIIKGKYKIVIEPGKSKVWEIFGKVESSGNFVKDVVACKNCSSVFKFTNSTSNLVKHKCYKNLKKLSDEPKIQVDQDTKNIVADTFTKWVTTNCRPLKMVQDAGLKKYTGVILSIGENYGSNIDTDHLLPHPTTVSRHIDNLYNAAHDSLKLELRELSAFGLTSYLWTDTHLKQSFLSLTIHFIKNGRIEMKLVSFQPMDFEYCTGEKIIRKVMAALNEFECPLDKGIIVTDRGSNMITAFKTYDQLFCVSRMLHSIVERSIEECPDIREICKNCIKLVTYFKTSGANAQLKTSLKSFSVTRWNSIYYLLQSVESNWNDIINILQIKNQTHRISNITLNTLTDIVTILKKFEESSKELEGDNYPTLHLVIVHVYFLKRVCETNNADDLECIKSFKLQLCTLIDDVVIKNLTIFHKIALFLFPPTNKLLHYTYEERNNIKLHCKNMLETLIIEQDHRNNEISSQSPLSNNKEQLFSGFIQRSIPINKLDQVQNELLLYENTNEVMHDNFDVLQWWELNKLKFPLLFKLSLKILAAPASSASSEKVFLNAKNLLSEKRCVMGSNPLTKTIAVGIIIEINQVFGQ